MFRKAIKNRCYVILILFAFCLSSATFGSSLLLGSDAHFLQDNVHVHHTDKDHGLGGSDHKDANTILYLEYVVVNSINPVKTLSTLNPCLQSYHSPNYCYNLLNNFLKITHYSNKNKFCTHNLYQLNSSYLI
jgi:hypothetical protein